MKHTCLQPTGFLTLYNAPKKCEDFQIGTILKLWVVSPENISTYVHEIFRAFE